MNKKKYQVKVPDVHYYFENVPCQQACPVHTKGGSYVAAVAEGDYEKAYALAREPSPFPYVCGRVCAHPCEDACRRGKFDEPVAIRALKRTATDHHDLTLGHGPALPIAQKKEEKVAIIGAGPAGLSAAHDLATLGYRVTVFEASPVAGGMLHLGLPEYRIPREIVNMEIEAILNLGVELKTDTPIGDDLTLGDLKEQGYQAVFIAIGAHKSRDLRIEGVDLDGVLKGVDFLLNVNLGYKVELGQKVVVIGGGNVAIDVARSALRNMGDIDDMSPEAMKEALDVARVALRQVEVLGTKRREELRGDMTEALDVARSALRMGVKEVHMVCLESRVEMPAHDWEIEDAEEEGITLHPSLGPKRILGQNGKVIGLETIAVASVFDSQGRFNPTFIEGAERVMKTDTLILAIGQASDLSFLRESDGVRVTPRGTIDVNPETLATSAPEIFAGGDIAFGPRLIIDAIADGQKAARAIDTYLQGGKFRKKIRMTTTVTENLSEDHDRVKRQKMPTLPLNRRIGITEVEQGFPDDIATLEGTRCFKCKINPVFDSDKCILCGGCVDVCPESCLSIVTLDRLYGDENLKQLVQARYGISREELQNGEVTGVGAAIIKDEELCLRCGLCAQRCPMGAITMEVFEFQEEFIYEK